MSWSAARPPDLPGILDLILPREWECVNLSSRLLQNGQAALPPSRSAGIALFKEDAVVRRCVFISRHGMLIPYLPGPDGEAGFTGLEEILFKDRGPVQSMVGIAAYVKKLGSALGIKPLVTVDYHLMVLDSGGSAKRKIEIPGMAVRMAGPGDLDRLMPLQEAYEREEVVLRPELYDRERSMSEFKLSLARNIIFIAEYQGRAVAKAGSNAIGFSYNQIGGVFTLPEMRGKKIARVLMEELLSHFKEIKKRACLFVKKSNGPALILYRNLGFRIAEDYQISYFQL